MNSEAVEKIELRIAYLERANNELSDVVYEQQREITELRTRVEDLVARIETLQAEPLQSTPEQERPPHY
jgi:uncharacterized coiled-coil protein SlyX